MGCQQNINSRISASLFWVLSNAAIWFILQIMGIPSMNLDECILEVYSATWQNRNLYALYLHHSLNLMNTRCQLNYAMKPRNFKYISIYIKLEWQMDQSSHFISYLILK